MKRKLLLIGNIIGAALILFVIIAGITSHFSFFTDYTKSFSEALAIGIIGGADGPTSIFVSGSFNLTIVLPLLLVGGLLIFNVVYFIRNR